MMRLRILALSLAAFVAAGASAQDDLGRLFFTPAQRAALDAGKHIKQPRKTEARTPRKPSAITLNGVVLRSDGDRTVWINDHVYHDRDPSGMKIQASPKSPGIAEIRIHGAKKTLELRVGQTYRRAAGNAIEVEPAPETPGKSSNAGTQRSDE